MIAIETTIHVSTQVLGDIAITAAEGGIGYWSVIDEYHPTRSDALGIGWVSPNGATLDVPDDFVFYTIDYENPAGPGYLKTDITPELIARGIGLFLRAGHFNDPDLSAMDAAEADTVIQYGVFGEVVFS